jgi:hypothetical protein
VFSGRIPFVWLSNQYSRSGVDFATTIINGQDELNEQFFEGLSQQERIDLISDIRFRPTFANGEERFEVNLTNPNLRMPQEWRSTLGVDQKLPYGIIGSVDLMYSKTIYDIYYANLNLAGVAGQDDKGRNLYGRGPLDPYLVDGQNFTDVYVVENTREGRQYSATGTLKKTVNNLFAQLSYTYANGKSVGNNSNSIAGGNWASVPIVQDPNNPPLAFSDFNRPHRVVGNLSYDKQWNENLGTTFGVYFNAQSGRRYSFTYQGDANFDTNDTRDDRDLIYVPNRLPDFESSGQTVEEYVADLRDEIIFTGTPEEQIAQYEAFNELIESDSYLRDRRGQFAERNAGVGRWNSRLDLTVKQRIGLDVNNKKHNLEVSAVLQNAANLAGSIFNEPWGKQYITFSNISPLQVAGFNDAENDIEVTYRDVGDINRVNRFGSVWRLQLGVRYSF